MNLSGLTVLLALAPQPAPPGTQANPQGQMFGTLGMLVIMVVMFYFVLIRPQQKKAKEHAQLLKTIKRGDEIITTGGIIGDVVNVKEKTVILRSADAKFEIAKSAVAEITKRSGENSES
ncbi:MAG TPA: preprotein translocase subunit YajC [Clostridia bacterium]|nr:preprotein translocase subunit YajC [Clostridia bacterium]